MKGILDLLIKMNRRKIQRDTIRAVIAELETQKKVLANIRSDDLDEAYGNGINMAIYIVTEMITDK